MGGELHLTGIAIVAVAATLCGLLMARLRQPEIVGYILAGIILGPAGIGLVNDREQVGALAELGVLMLLYFVGMELSLRSFRKLWRIGLISTVMQIGGSFLAMWALTAYLDWPLKYAVFFAFVLALSSTAVAVKMLGDIGQLRTRVGRITIGVLIAQDLAVAPMMLIVGSMASDGISVSVVVRLVVSVGLIVGIIAYLTRRQRTSLPFAPLILGNHDLTSIAALAWCFGLAAVAGLIGLSAAFGAFLAGLIVGNSAQRQEIFRTAKPFESVLIMIFFLSIGLLIDLRHLWANLGLVLLLWALATVFKTALNTAVLRLLGEPWPRAFESSLILAQIGEFSFVLGAVALSRGVIDTDLHRLIVSVTALSLFCSPLWMASARRLNHRAAYRVHGLSALLRLIYFRERRISRQVGRTFVEHTTTWLAALRRFVGPIFRRPIKPSKDPEVAAQVQSADGSAEKPNARPLT
jgi:CPA2 family monovalent cation:H+ antiporter-2